MAFKVKYSKLDPIHSEWDENKIRISKELQKVFRKPKTYRFIFVKLCFSTVILRTLLEMI